MVACGPLGRQPPSPAGAAESEQKHLERGPPVRAEAVTLGVMNSVRRGDRADLDGPCHSLSFAAVAVVLALIALYVGTAVAESIVTANRDSRAVAGMVAYYAIVLGG